MVNWLLVSHCFRSHRYLSMAGNSTAVPFHCWFNFHPFNALKFPALVLMMMWLQHSPPVSAAVHTSPWKHFSNWLMDFKKQKKSVFHSQLLLSRFLLIPSTSFKYGGFLWEVFFLSNFSLDLLIFFFKPTEFGLLLCSFTYPFFYIVLSWCNHSSCCLCFVLEKKTWYCF